MKDPLYPIVEKEGLVRQMWEAENPEIKSKNHPSFVEKLKPLAKKLVKIVKNAQIACEQTYGAYKEKADLYRPRCFILTLASEIDLVIQEGDETLTAYIPSNKSQEFITKILEAYKEITSKPIKIKRKES